MDSLKIEALTRGAFAPFGQVLEADGADHFLINEGTTTRFHSLAQADTGSDGTAIISIFRGTCRGFPFPVRMLECHPLGSQAFMPLSPDGWLIVVAEEPDPKALRCFRASGRQGVQYAKGVWHHPLLVLIPEQNFLIVDRDGPGENLIEVRLPETRFVSL